MKYGICHYSLVPLRKLPAHTQEMTTELLFGEHFSILENQNEWLKIRCSHDKYEGWIPEGMFIPLSRKEYLLLEDEDKMYFCGEPTLMVRNEQTGQEFPITLGSRLPFLKKNKFQIGAYPFTLHGKSVAVIKPESTKNITETAYRYLNAPYLWGGRSLFGIDCSGFVQMCFRFNSIALPRDAWQQEKKGRRIQKLSSAREADLAFFSNTDGKIVHTGILINKDIIIHASERVRIDKIDEKGIYNEQKGKYTHNLCGIKRIIGN